MATTELPSPASEPRRRWHLVLPVLALLFQALPPLAIWAVASGAYSEPPQLSEAWERRWSLLVLAASAAGGLLLGSFSVFGLLRHSRPRVAVPLLLLCCLPALLGGAVYLHALLIFLAWV